MDAKLLAGILQVLYICIPLILVSLIVLYNCMTYSQRQQQRAGINSGPSLGDGGSQSGFLVRFNELTVQRLRYTEYIILLRNIRYHLRRLQNVDIEDVRCPPHAIDNIVKAAARFELDDARMERGHATSSSSPLSHTTLSHIYGTVESDSSAECMERYQSALRALDSHLERLLAAASKQNPADGRDIYIDLSTIIDVVEYPADHYFRR